MVWRALSYTLGEGCASRYTPSLGVPKGKKHGGPKLIKCILPVKYGDKNKYLKIPQLRGNVVTSAWRRLCTRLRGNKVVSAWRTEKNKLIFKQRTCHRAPTPRALYPTLGDSLDPCVQVYSLGPLAHDI